MSGLPGWASALLACPRCHAPLESDEPSGELRCASGHAYPVVDGIPVLLLDDARPTQPGYWATTHEVHPTDELDVPPDGIDPYVRLVLLGTSGNLYRAAGERLARYPIPEFPLRDGEDRIVIDIGSNWGRWCVAAARAGFRPVGIDPSLGAVRAARRVAAQLGVEAAFAVADGRHLPFRSGSADVVFSYSVLQHFAKEDVRACLGSAARVLAEDGTALVQMASSRGLWNTAKRARRRFAEPAGFDVRYWSRGELRAAFRSAFGSALLSADGFFSLNPQAADGDLLSALGRAVVACSGVLCSMSRALPPLAAVADSVYVEARKAA